MLCTPGESSSHHSQVSKNLLMPAGLPTYAAHHASGSPWLCSSSRLGMPGDRQQPPSTGPRIPAHACCHTDEPAEFSALQPVASFQAVHPRGKQQPSATGLWISAHECSPAIKLAQRDFPQPMALLQPQAVHQRGKAAVIAHRSLDTCSCLLPRRQMRRSVVSRGPWLCSRLAPGYALEEECTIHHPQVSGCLHIPAARLWPALTGTCWHAGPPG